MKKKKQQKLNVFDAIQELESEDAKAATRRRKTTAGTAQRAKAAQSQTKIYNHLVECRILFQRALLLTTTTTTTTNVEEENENDKQTASSEKEVGDADSSVGDQCDALIATLLQARNKLVKGNDDNDDDEYADVDSDDALNNLLDKEYNNCREQWKEVLNRRHKDLKLHSGITAKSQFRVIDSSFWQQVESTVEYEQMREQHHDDGDDDDGDDESSSPSKKKQEVVFFDDSKVYQQLLKEFVASSAEANDGGVVAAASKRLSNKRKSSQSGNKKDVDRRASKGRKIRYKEIPKLTNFTFPLSRPVTSNLDQDEWFRSLFGGVGRSQK